MPLRRHDRRMPNLAFDLRRSGGLAHSAQLRSWGHTPRDIRAAIEAGAACRIRRSWIASSAANPDALRAVAARGVLGGESALRSHGIWVSRHTGLCVVSAPTASRLPALGPGSRR